MPELAFGSDRRHRTSPGKPSSLGGAEGAVRWTAAFQMPKLLRRHNLYSLTNTLIKFEPSTFNRNVTDEELIEDLVASGAKLKALGKSLTFRSYKEVGKYSASTIGTRFGTWNEGLLKAGLIPNEEKHITTEVLFDNIKMVWIAKGKQPVYRDMSSYPSQYTGSTYNERFGGWRKALEEFVASTDKEQNDLLVFEAKVKNQNVTKRTKRDPSLALRFFVLKRDRFTCVTCGRSPATIAGLVLEIDHVFPWSKGGETIEENLQTLCFDCNRGKGITEI